MTTQIKQLKKNDFLAHLSDEPMTKGELVDALENYDFIDSYLDYLIDHFAAQGKLIKTDDGKFHRKAKRQTSPKEAFRVVFDEDSGECSMETAQTSRLLTEEQKEDGWATTPNAAIKKMSSAIFAQYKEDVAAVKALEGTEAVEVELDSDEG